MRLWPGVGWSGEAGGSIDNRTLGRFDVVGVIVSSIEMLSVCSEFQCETNPGSTGVIDVASALCALEGMGYQGPVTPVPSRSSFGSTRRDAIVKQTGQSLSQLWKAMEEGSVGAAAAVASS